MNFLAHLYFADDTPDSRVGSLLGDFVKGCPDTRFSPETLQGIRLHRAVDRFTDIHPTVMASKNLISPERRRFAGIIVDICYDHFLCKNWQRYSDCSLAQFCGSVYESLQTYDGYLPERARGVIEHMVMGDWLNSYQSVDGIADVLNRVSRRLKRTNSLYGAGDELVQNYTALDQHFLHFFPDLISFVLEFG